MDKLVIFNPKKHLFPQCRHELATLAPFVFCLSLSHVAKKIREDGKPVTKERGRVDNYQRHLFESEFLLLTDTQLIHCLYECEVEKCLNRNADRIGSGWK